MLHEWAMGEDGAWLGQVTYKLVSSDNVWNIEVTHYVPGHLIKPRDLTRRHRLR